MSGRGVSNLLLRIALLVLLMSGAISCFHAEREVELFLEEGLEEYKKVLPPLPEGWAYLKDDPAEQGSAYGSRPAEGWIYPKKDPTEADGEKNATLGATKRGTPTEWGSDVRVEVIRTPPEGLTTTIAPSTTQFPQTQYSTVPPGPLPLTQFSSTRTIQASEDQPPSYWIQVFEKPLSTLPYAPRTSYLDPTISVDKGRSSSFPLFPLDTIQLPYKALRVGGVGGSSPRDPEYPYQGRIVLRISVKSSLPSNASSRPQRYSSKESPAIVSSTLASDLKRLIQWAESIPPLEEEKLLWIGAVGDVLPGRGVDHLLLEGKNGISHVFGDTLSILRKQDLLLGNLEGPLTTRGTPITKAYTFRFPPAVLRVLKKVGFKYFSLTNNHIWDFGEVGLLDTLHAFQTFGMGTSGIGRSIEEARVPWKFIPEGGRAVRILSMGAYPPEQSGFDGKLVASVRNDRPGILWAQEETLQSLHDWIGEGGFNILMVHGGYEWASTPHHDQVYLYRKFIDTGADIVFGSHPHVVQGMEVYRGKLIFYSLGNFLFPGMDGTSGGEESILVSCGVYAGKVRYVEVYPLRLQGPTVRLDPSKDTLKRFYQLSRALRELYPVN